jgi:hypothetical protein
VRNSINLTFKNNREETELYEWLCKRTTNKSGFIKDLLMREKAKEEIKETKIMKGFITLEQ